MNNYRWYLFRRVLLYEHELADGAIIGRMLVLVTVMVMLLRRWHRAVVFMRGYNVLRMARLEEQVQRRHEHQGEKQQKL